ncbi:CAP domain-containing protein [[Clostridium] colinum]|uniref:CAP domain-containing protein n=1 Tax=[Clostridium] colinum TaxID=36835 RepID=UPI0020252347|nr:CAP domain-containing protein [[Clostridium] colinum]
MKKFIKLLASSIILTNVSLNSTYTFANQCVKISVNNRIANVNGYDQILNTEPYIQKSSYSMMIPLRVVLLGLGIDENNIEYNAKDKTIIITNGDKTVKFISGTNKMIINGKVFEMVIKSLETGKNNPVYTEIKNGSAFIPLRSLELCFGIKTEWEGSTKTATLINENNISNLPVNKEKTIPKDLQVNEDINSKYEEEVVRLVNNERTKLGLNSLKIDENLIRLSRQKSKDMAINNYFEHTSPVLGSPADVMRENNLTFNWMGENIAAGQTTPKEVVDSWMNSKSHRENILNPEAKYIGVGFYEDKNSSYNYYWTQQFIG